MLTIPAVRGYARVLEAWIDASLASHGEGLSNDEVKELARRIAPFSTYDLDHEFYEIRFNDGSTISFSKED